MSNLMDDIYKNIFKTYGLKELSLEEEFNSPKYVKQTRHNKVKIIDTCKHAKNLIETIERRANGAPELDDPKHAALVQELADKVNELYKAIEEACMVGYR